MAVVDLDLSPWDSGGHVNFDRGPTNIGLSFWRPVDEKPLGRGRTTVARPVTVNITSPIGGSLLTTDPGYLRDQARRLLDAADTLDALHLSHPPTRLTLTMEDTTA